MPNPNERKDNLNQKINYFPTERHFHTHDLYEMKKHFTT